MVVGGFGGVMVGLLLIWLFGWVSWCVICFGFVVLMVVVVVLIGFGVFDV